MTRVPKVTVCLPTFNRAHYLPQALSSVLTQSFQDFEVLVSDNCSSDDTSGYMATVTDSRVRYIRNAVNIGLFPNMNQCIEQARGEYVCILHDDDLYAPHFLEREVRMMEAHPSVGFIHTAAYQIDATGRRLGLYRSYPTDCVRPSGEEFVSYLAGHNVWFATVMVRRELYRQVGGYDPAFLCSDFGMWLRLALRADIGYIAEPLAAIRLHSARLTSTMLPKRWSDEFFAIVDEALRRADVERPGLVRSRAAVMHRAVRVQGRRFLIAGLEALSAGDADTARGFADVLQALRSRGLPASYAWTIGLLQNAPGRAVLRIVRDLRRAWRTSQLPAETAWSTAPAPLAAPAAGKH
jgi:cellulose synthase/poly-beta-1,6-N-acetylglucosamine synthase-like glycosyltransferase